MNKIAWSGTLVGVQPRINLLRSFDERQHSYLGYLLILDGTVNGVQRTFTLRVGRGTHAKHALHAGLRLRGMAQPAADADRECADLYKVSGLDVAAESIAAAGSPPPWRGVPPPLEVYRARGHRRLDPRAYETRCLSCHWACRMAVTMILDQWNPQKRLYRFETFCYGPKSCALYRPGATRKVPGRRGMSWEEEDWVDEEATAHRSADE